MTDTPNLQAADQQAADVQKTDNRVTLDSIKAKVAKETYYHPDFAPHVTIVAVQMTNGFVLVGKSSPADPANFNAELGRKFALEDALREAWALEGYLLREKLAA